MNKDNDTENSTSEAFPSQKSELPKVFARQPSFVKLTKGQRYFWCACGLSESQPFCDGSHKGTEFGPLKYVPEKDEEVFLCQCKHTKKVPFCDGSHSQAPAQKRDNS
jgi:CDGSH-type Zn-finger protein